MADLPDRTQHMKVALTIWNHRIAPVFDVTSSALIVDTQDDSTRDRQMLDLSGKDAVGKMAAIAACGADSLICGAISRPALAAGEECGVQIHAFIAGEAEEVLHAWMDDRLADAQFAMPGCNLQRKAPAPRTGKQDRAMESPQGE